MWKDWGVLLVLAVLLPTMPAQAADIYLTCSTHNDEGSKQILNYQINESRVIANGSELSKEVTISSAAIIYKQNFEIMGKLLGIFTITIDRSTGDWVEQRLFPDKMETKIYWTGNCTKADPPVQKF